MKLWANSGDSHYNEPPDLYDALPQDLRERMPRSVKSEDGTYETIYVDGTSFKRPMPRIGIVKGKKGRTLSEALQAPGARDFTIRRQDLDDEGIWGEVIYASVGFWNSMITDPHLIGEAVKVVNDWSADVQRQSIRHVMPAQVSALDIDDAVAEVERCAGLGLKALGLPPGAPKGVPAFNRHDWDPLWDAAEETGMVLTVHTGPPVGEDPVHHHGPGAGTMNYLYACYGGMDMAAMMAASGILDKRPGLKLLISEAGASWLPFIADRLDEAFRQHSCATSSRRRPARWCASRCTRRSSTIRRRCSPSPRWAFATSCGAATTPTSKGPSGTPRRPSTSSSTTRRRKCRTGSVRARSSSCSHTSGSRPSKGPTPNSPTRPEVPLDDGRDPSRVHEGGTAATEPEGGSR
jgi:predicted TIM-barrel fold metal-dependent hydrolase